MLDPENDATESAAQESTPSGADPVEAPSAPPGTDADTGEVASAPVKKAAARAPRKSAAKKTTAKRAASKSAATDPAALDADAGAEPAKKTTRAPRKSAAAAISAPTEPAAAESAEAAQSATPDAPSEGVGTTPLFQAPAVTTTVRKRGTRRASAVAKDAPAETPDASSASSDEPEAPVESATPRKRARKATSTPPAQDPAPETEAVGTGEDADAAETEKPAKKKSGKKKTKKTAEGEDGATSPKAKKKSGKKVVDEAEDEDVESPVEATPATEDDETSTEDTGSADDADTETDGEGGGRRRPRRRGGRRRRRGGSGGESGDAADSSEDEARSGEPSDDEASEDSDDEDANGSGSRRRRRRRRGGGGNGGGNGDGERRPRNPEDEITALSGSTRLEAKKQRRREGREAGRRRAPIVSEAEFLARRESVERVMVVRQREDLTQIGVLEDKVLVEHYVSRESQTSMIGNVYLGRVQNVLPSMEAAFIDIGKGRNAVLYAGEVNWKALGAKDGQARKIESVLSPGQTLLVQVSKDPIGHKGARLTSQVSLPGRFLVYVPDGTTSGISRKLPEGERGRLKALLKEIVPDSAGVIVRTAAEGASEDELTKDVERLTARWSDIEAKVASGGGKGGAPQLLYGEPDLTLKVVRDLFTEDFSRLVVEGDDAWDLVDGYVSHVAPDLRERLEHYRPEDEGNDGVDLFAAHRVDEQIAKGLDRKVWLPSGGSLVIDRTEAMTVVDVNTGKFTGSGGNLEETVTKNNLEAAEEIVRQLRLRDIGGIVVVDFIDMVLEGNRDLVLRRLVECLGRDRTRHQVAEVTSLGLVQMTRKRIGTGLLEAFSEECSHCKGRGLTVHDHPVEQAPSRDDDSRRGGRRGRGGSGGSNGARHGNGGGSGNGNGGGAAHAPSPKDVAAMARPENADKPPADEVPADFSPVETGGEVAPQPPAESRPAVPAPVEVEGSAPEVSAAPEAAEPGETSAEPPAEPEQPAATAPAVVTSTRRRTARRAAGRPAGAPSATTTPAESPADPPSVEPRDPEVSLDPGPADAPVVEDETLPLDDAGERADDAADQVGDDGVLPVPVKRRGGRRR